MEITFEIPGEMTDLNTHLKKTNTHWAGGQSIKNHETQKVKLIASQYRSEAEDLELPVDVHFHWVCSSRRKDKDNIRFAAKYILDGLEAAGIIPNDGWKEIGKLSDTFERDKDDPRVEVTITG